MKKLLKKALPTMAFIAAFCIMGNSSNVFADYSRDATFTTYDGYTHDVCGNVYDQWGYTVYSSPACLMDAGYDPFEGLVGTLNGGGSWEGTASTDQWTTMSGDWVTDPWAYGSYGKISIPNVGTFDVARGSNQNSTQGIVDSGIVAIDDVFGGLVGVDNETGGSGISVLAHSKNGVFDNLDNVKVGDIVTIETAFGTFRYQITGTTVTQTADDLWSVIKGHDMTLTACYPLDEVNVYNPDARFNVTAELYWG